jgi:hypothetical protein
MAPKRSAEYLAVERFAKDIGRYREYLRDEVAPQIASQQPRNVFRILAGLRHARSEALGRFPLPNLDGIGPEKQHRMDSFRREAH